MTTYYETEDGKKFVEKEAAVKHEEKLHEEENKKKKLEDEKYQRAKEVQEAYDKYKELLIRYEEDYYKDINNYLDRLLEFLYD